MRIAGELTATDLLIIEALNNLAVGASGEVVRKSGITSFVNIAGGENSFSDGETPSGSINGSNTSFTLANTPVAGTVELYLNGTRLRSGASNDYTISGVTITMNYAPASGDVLLVDYQY